MVPRVSVIIPVHNGADTIARAIDSALAQTYEGGFEIIVVNNGSTDESGEMIRRYGDKLVALDEPNPGVSAARNTAVNVARGEYLAFLDADDEWLPDKLARTVPVLDERPDAVLVHHDALAVDIRGKVCSEWVIPRSQPRDPSLERVISSYMMLPSCTVMRREIYVRCGGCNVRLPRAQDRFLFIAAREHGPFLFVPEALTRYEFVLTRDKEERLLALAPTFRSLMREQFGLISPLDTSMPVRFALVHMARGERRLARQRYLLALRRRPLELTTYLQLVWTYIPRRLARELGAALPVRYARALNGPPDGHWRCIAL
jgi:glycosyltransferase involved in cell wall biosynthesis